MGLLSGLEKFGLGAAEELDILAEDKPKKKAAPAATKKKPVVLQEKDYLLDKKVTCTVCDQEFDTRTVATSKLKRIDPDDDLRPRFEHIDTLKYGVYACPHCGYAALIKDFEHVSSTQRKWIRESICSNFKPMEEPKVETYTYDTAVEKYKLALVNTMAKKGKLSEKSYICLNIAWLRRAQLETLPDTTTFYKQQRGVAQEEFEGFYKQAYEGFLKVASTETPPYYGLDANTVDYMLAQMSMYYKRYDIASKLVGRLLTSSATPRRMKDKCLDMKDVILEEIKK